MLEARRGVWRQAALESAARLFAANGFQATSMRDVANDSGLALRALYQAFASKDELFVAVVDSAYARLLPALTDDEDDVVDPGARVLRVIDGMFSSVNASRGAFLIHARGNQGSSAKLVDGRDPFAPYVELVNEQVARIVGAAQDAGHAAGIPPRVIAAAMIATVTALCQQAFASDPEADVTRLAPSVRALFEPHFSSSGSR